MSKYLKAKQTIARVDNHGTILGKIDKWGAHKKGVLHRGFSIALIYKGKYIIQHRKHLVFDGYYDLTSSSHQIFQNGIFQTINDAAYDCLEREWGLTKNDFTGRIKVIGEIYYKAKDPNSIYTEHEKCAMLIVEIKSIPTPNFEYAYGFSLVTKEELKNPKILSTLCPWSRKAVNERIV